MTASFKTAERDQDLSWQEEAACLSEDPALFWIDRELDDPETRTRKMKLAKKICAGCPVIQQCGWWGLREAKADRWSVIGGMSHLERRMIRLELGIRDLC